jgi:hypothetical protein
MPIVTRRSAIVGLAVLAGMHIDPSLGADDALPSWADGPLTLWSHVHPAIIDRK